MPRPNLMPAPHLARAAHTVRRKSPCGLGHNSISVIILPMSEIFTFQAPMSPPKIPTEPETRG
jgi:hypothetical protein